jgi:hypothetical protein
MIPKSGNRFSDQIMRNQTTRMIPKSGNRFSAQIMRSQITRMIPKKPVPDLIRDGNRGPDHA